MSHIREVCLTGHDTLVVIAKKLHMNPLTEGIRLETFGSPDYPVVLDSLLSDGDSVDSNKNLLKFGGLLRKRV